MAAKTWNAETILTSFVQNTRCDILPEGDLNRLFDRFYRARISLLVEKYTPEGGKIGCESRYPARENRGGADASRAKRGGYGLSVAAAIVKAHKGKITAERTRDGICFKAVFPAKG